MPFAFYLRSICMYHFSGSLHVILFEHSLIKRSVRPLEVPKSLFTPFLILASETGTIPILFLTTALFQPILPSSFIVPIGANIFSLALKLIINKFSLIVVTVRKDKLSEALHIISGGLSDVYSTIFPSDDLTI